MDEKDRIMLKEVKGLVEENNSLLRKMHRKAVYSSMFRIGYWLIIIVASVSAYYAIEPYYQKAKLMYETANKQIQTVQNATDKLNSVLPAKK